MVVAVCRALCAASAAILCTALAQAAEKVQIRSERMTSSGNVEIIYSGAVVLEHPNLRIEAESISFTRSADDERVISFQADGAPVQIQHWQKSQSRLSGHANRIRYHQADNQFILTGNAEINQADGASLRGEEIIYNAPPLGRDAAGDAAIFQGRKAGQ